MTMLELDRSADALMTLTRIYSTYYQFCDLPMNKTIDISEICTHIARLKYMAGDFDDALHFYREAIEKSRGENAQKELGAAIAQIEREQIALKSSRDSSGSHDHPIQEISVEE
jgi:tetratricopeptide (TPR) repeat protein